MIYLFIHQNFPGQYAHLARHLAAQPGNKVYFLTQSVKRYVPGVETIVYPPDTDGRSICHPYNLAYESAVRTGLKVHEACKTLRARGIVPDLVVGHSGWGETMLVKDVFPDTPVLAYFEYYYVAQGADVGFDSEFGAARPDDRARLRLRNAVNHMAFASADWGHTPTAWQRSLYPAEMRARIAVLHEGVDTDEVRPDPDATLTLPDGLTLTRRDEVVTYVARNLEPHRGFHCFMRALPEIMGRRPNAHIVVVGGDGVSYGDLPPYGNTWREMLLAEQAGRIDRARVHFLGQIPRDQYLRVLQVSSAHVYLTYPFVLSWSCLEAMAAGCAVVGARVAPVVEVLEDRHTGLLVNMFDPGEIADRVVEVLGHPDGMRLLRARARATAVERYDLRARALPAWEELLGNLARGRAPEVAA